MLHPLFHERVSLEIGITRGNCKNGSTEEPAPLNWKYRRWLGRHQNNKAEDCRLTGGFTGQGVDRDDHCKERDDSFRELYPEFVENMKCDHTRSIEAPRNCTALLLERCRGR